MAEFIFTGPDGKKVKVTGDTQAGAIKAFQMAMGQTPGPTPNTDGTYGQPPKGMITDPNTGQMIDTVQRDEFDQRVLAAKPYSSRAVEVVQGLPLAGEWIDEAVGKISPQAGENMTQMSDAMERQHPVQSGALNMAGGVLAAAPIAGLAAGTKAVDFVRQGANVLTRGLRAGAIAAPAGMVEGASSFAGRSEGDRLKAAGEGAVVGGGLALALGPFASMFGEGATAIAKRVKKLDVKTIADQFGISPSAARTVKGHLINDDLDAATRILSRGNDDSMLADAGSATRQALDNAMSTGGKALSVARTRINARAQAAGTRLTASLDGILGKPGGLKSATSKIAQRTRATRKKAYDFAYSQPTPMVGESAAAIDDVLSRIDPETMTAAIKEANAEMLHRGMKNANIMASIDDAGNVTFTQPLSVIQLDHIARGLGTVAEAATDSATGHVARGGVRAIDQAKALRDALKSGVKGYRGALKRGGDAIAEREALLMGRKIFNQGTTFEDVITTMRGASDEVKAAAKQGMRQHIDDVMGRIKTTLTDIEQGTFDFDTGMDAAREALAAVKLLGSRNNYKKARAILGPDADRFFFEMTRAADALALRSAVAKNSATAIRQAGQAQMAAEAAPGLVRRTVGNMGNPFDAINEVSQAATGIDAASISRIVQENADEVADALTRIRGPEALKALEAVRRAMSGQPLKDIEAELVGRVLSGSAGVAGYQATKRPLQPR